MRIDTWWLDLKLGVRMLVKYPGLALAGGAGMAVAVAIAAGGFSFIYGTVRAAALPLEEGGRVVAFELWDTALGKPESRTLYEYHAWRAGLKSVNEISAFRSLTPNLITPGSPPESVRVAAMTASGFRVARVAPLRGRVLLDSDERPGAPPVAVIAEDVWRSRFAADPAILGRTVQLGSTQYAIAGVMPAGFAFPVNHHFWIPLSPGPAPAAPLAGAELHVFGRLASGATLSEAQAELTAAARRTAREFPKAYAPLRPLVLPYVHPFMGLRSGDDLAGVMAMQGLFISLLVLVCLNVAILVYTRTATRQAEIGVRTALGASRGRIIGQLFVEALVLSLAAAGVGLGLAVLAYRQMAASTLHIAAELPFWISFQLSPQAAPFAVGLALLAAVIVGVLPAWQATRRGLLNGTRIAGTGGLRLGTTWTVLIVAQVGFAVVLLPPAVASAWRDTQDGWAGLGFRAERFLAAQVDMDPGPGGTTPEFTRLFAQRQNELMRRLEADPRVSGITYGQQTPGDERGARIELQSLAGEADRETRHVRVNRVEPGFFRTFEVPVLAGRDFSTADAPVAGEGRTVVVNQILAEKLFGGRALGRRLRYVKPNRETAEPEGWYEIVGVVPHFPRGASQGMRDEQLTVYHAAAPGQVQPATLAIRLRDGAGAAYGQRLRELAAGVDPGLQLRQIRAGWTRRCAASSGSAA